MKTIGLIGGMSWESTMAYYQMINEVIKEELGGLHSAKVLLYSVDFDEIEKCQAAGDWDRSAHILSGIAMNLENAGADFIVICTNTMHRVVPFMQAKIHIPILHIAKATAEKLKENYIDRIALLGTKYTMLQDFYKSKLIEMGIDVVIPEDEDIEIINNIIYDELCLGKILEHSKKEYIRINNKLKKKGAQGVVLGCTEIGLLIDQNDCDIPVFDTTQIHARKAALFALDKSLK